MASDDTILLAEMDAAYAYLKQRLIECATTIRNLQEENERLKRGEFTPEEVQNFCHNLKGTLKEFCKGCEEYQQKLYGSSPAADLRAAVRDYEEAWDKMEGPVKALTSARETMFYHLKRLAD